jgi:hypothetical protein
MIKFNTIFTCVLMPQLDDYNFTTHLGLVTVLNGIFHNTKTRIVGEFVLILTVNSYTPNISTHVK